MGSLPSVGNGNPEALFTRLCFFFPALLDCLRLDLDIVPFLFARGRRSEWSVEVCGLCSLICRIGGDHNPGSRLLRMHWVWRGVVAIAGLGRGRLRIVRVIATVVIVWLLVAKILLRSFC